MAGRYAVRHVSRRFADDFEIPDHRVTGLAIFEEGVYVHALDILLDLANRLQDILNAQPPFSNWH
jgi:hypothetical protein